MRLENLRREGFGEHVWVGGDLDLGGVGLEGISEVVLGDANAFSVEELVVDGLGEEVGSLLSHIFDC